MNKPSDILDSLWLNLAICAGTIVLLAGRLFEWNDFPVWRIVSSAGGGAVILWVIGRFITVCRAGIGITDRDSEADIPEVKPGFNRNALRELLQPASFALFAGLLLSVWFEIDGSPAWLIYASMAAASAIAFLNFDYYTRREQ